MEDSARIAVVNSPGWLSQEIYDHQHSWWAKGILGFTGAINSDAGQWLSRSLNTDGASAKKMDPFSAMGNTAAGYDPITGQAIGIEQGYKNFGESMAGMFGGEVAGVGVGIGLGFAADALPSVGRNSASMFGRSEANALSPMRLRVMANIADARAGIKASFFDIHAVVEKILGFDVSTESNEAVFWSGPGNRELAENYAIATNKLTLGMKPDGQYLESLDLFSKFPYRQAVIPWARLSEKFAKEASGNISAFVEGASSTSIFTTVEKPILISNPSITITYSPEFDSSYILKP